MKLEDKEIEIEFSNRRTLKRRKSDSYLEDVQDCIKDMQKKIELILNFVAPLDGFGVSARLGYLEKNEKIQDEKINNYNDKMFEMMEHHIATHWKFATIVISLMIAVFTIIATIISLIIKLKV